MTAEILFIPLKRVNNPFIQSVKSYTSDTITFRGEFTIEEGTFPIERLVSIGGIVHHIELYEKKKLRHIPFLTAEEPHDKSFLFPGGLYELKYRLIKRLTTTKEQQEVEQQIEALEPDVVRRNWELLLQRLREERVKEKQDRESVAHVDKTIFYQ